VGAVARRIGTGISKDGARDLNGLLCYRQMLRLTLAVATGFLIRSVLVAATQVALLKFFFHNVVAGFETDQLPPAYLLADGVSNLFFAVIAGCTSAAIARKYEAPTILGALMLGMAIGGLVMHRGGPPVWYAATVPLLGAVVATMAGYSWLGRRPTTESSTRKGSRR
jgi:hypothetical protein